MNYASYEVIKTSRLILRPITLEDASLYHQHLSSNPNVAKYMLWQPETSFSKIQERLQAGVQDYETGRCYRWGIALADNNSLVGRIDLLRFNEENESCSFAYMLGSDFWGRGIATEALKAVIDFAFQKMELAFVEADCFEENVASSKVMQKVGMEYQCTIEGKYCKNGKSHDALCYLITKEMWNVHCRKNGDILNE